MRLPYHVLDSMLRQLMGRMFAGEISVEVYAYEYDVLVVLAGWTWDDFSREVDLRWPSQSSPVFRPQAALLC